MSWSEVNEFYQSYPIQSAVVTCAFKASLADGIAQFTSTTNKQWEVKRNLSYILYGGIFVGCMCHAEYHILFPLLFGTETPHVLEKVLLDNFVSAPLMWLPPAYLVKAFMYDETWQEGLTKYWKDITEQGLLLKYWMIWLPAQTVSFSYVPDHLRVAFMAMISFFWFILLSSVASASSDASISIVGSKGAIVEEELASRIPLITNK